MGHIPVKFQHKKQTPTKHSLSDRDTSGASKTWPKASPGGIAPSTSIKTGKTPKMPEAASNNASLRGGSKGYNFVSKTA